MTDTALAGATLADAFLDYPVWVHAEPDARVREAVLPWVFSRTLLHCERYGGIETSGDLAAVAGWVVGERLRLGPLDLLRTGLVATPLKLGAAATLRLERHERPCEQRLDELVQPGDGYLWVVGARRDRHGEGLGRRVIDAACAAMAARGLRACWLKTELATNVRIYERLGFAVVEELDASLPVWIMRRELPPGS